jgi:hypothetical protein
VPCCAVQGYGKFLISLAYCLSHLEGKPGTAERPLSDLGAVSFRSYWTRQVLDALRDCKGEVTVQVCGAGAGCMAVAWGPGQLGVAGSAALCAALLNHTSRVPCCAVGLIYARALFLVYDR